MKKIFSFIFMFIFIFSFFNGIVTAEVKLRKDIYVKDLIVGAMAFSPDGKWMVVSGVEGAADFRRGKMRISTEGGIWVLDAKKIKVKKCLAKKGTWPGEVIFSKDSQEVIGLIDHSIKLWKVKGGKPKIISKNIQNVAFSFDGRYVLAMKKDGSFEAFDIENRKKLGDFPKIAEEGKPLFVDSEELYVVFVKENSLHIKNLVGGQESVLGDWKGGDLGVLTLSPDRKILATGSSSGTVALWKLDENKKIAENDLAGTRINSMAFAPDGSSLVYGGVGKDLFLWKIGEEKVNINFGRHKLPIYAVAFGSNSLTIASGSFDGTVKIWEIE